MQNLKIVVQDFKISENIYHRYDLTYYSGLSTKEYTILVNITKSKITGDCVRFGEYGALSKQECNDILKLLKVHNKLIQNYEEIIENEIRVFTDVKTA